MDAAEVARRSVARVSFKWRNAESLDKKTAGEEIDMVITGVIVSVNIRECLMIMDPSFFRDRQRFSFHVNLPEENGNYGQTITVVSRNFIRHEEFIAVPIPVGKNHYIAPVKFETSPIGQSDLVFNYLFARETAISAAYVRGHIVASTPSQEDVGVVFHDCPLHEYGHIGSPIFNQKGVAVGICYATQSRTHAWTVRFLKKQFDKVLKGWSVTYVCSKKDPSQEGGSSCDEHTNQKGNPNEHSNPLSVHCSDSMPLPAATSPDASTHSPPPNSSLGMDVDPGDVPHPLTKRPKTGSAASLPLGVVTLACNTDASTTVTYFPGIIISSEQGQDNEYTTYIFSSHKPRFEKVYVYFEPTKSIEAEVCSFQPRPSWMMVCIKDKQFHEPIVWSSRMHPGYELVETVSIMAGTKLNAKSAAPIMMSLTSILGRYLGQITTPRCHAATATSCSILSGTENYFQLSCSFQEDFIDFKNIDLDRVTYQCNSVISAPVFSLKGEFVGIVVSSGNWPDRKTGLYSEEVLSIIEDLMQDFDNGWSKDKLKWRMAESV